MGFEESELGAVFFGDKPLCIEAIYSKPRNFDLDNRLVLIGESYRHLIPIWNRIASEKGPFALVAGTTDKEDDLPFWINKKAFLATVQQNLPLFQAVLGPLVTPERLLQECLTPGVNLFKVLHSNKTLFGILLGFGKENSMTHARIEEIEYSWVYRTKAPLKPNIIKPLKLLDEPPFVTWRCSSPLTLPHPTPGYASLEEEDRVLVNMCSTSSIHHPYAKERRVPLFGCIPYSRETKKLLNRYRAATDKTERLLAEDNFLPKALAVALGIPKVKLTLSPSLDSAFLDNFSLNRAVASVLVRGACTDALSYREGLVAGLKATGQSSIAEAYYSCLEAMHARLAHQNLAASDAFFSSISSEWTEVIPQQLYYRTLKPGTGTPVSQETKTVLISYSITPIEGTSSKDHSYEDTCGRDVQHFLAELIPGMSNALVGMRPRETREILAHPAHAYGVNSRFEPGVSLRIKATLRSHRGIAESLPPLEKLSLTLPEIKQDPDECLWALGHEAGIKAWAYLSQAADLIDCEEIIKELEAWDPGNEEDVMAFSYLQIELCRRHHGL
ncbi:MAG: hypothetical protein JSR80_05165 [Verrucomicrobia bacterium]|nr:hypothetical protein [Verrucomicrobiota bacterium]